MKEKPQPKPEIKQPKSEKQTNVPVKLTEKELKEFLKKNDWGYPL